MASLAQLKEVACNAIDRVACELHGVSKAIWDKPELCFEEYGAHDVLCNFLGKHGFQVEQQYKLDTAFRAVHGGEGPNVAILSEYDALPDIGHACGHNLIAEVGVGAGVGIKAALQEAKKNGQTLGKVTVLGTPAEEGGGGKVLLIDEFRDVDVAMMAHPFPIDLAAPLTLAICKLDVKYIGKASHAACAPWTGLNALDAAVMAYANVSCLRQQMKPNWRVHGIIKNGGTKPNIIPEETLLQYYVRAPTLGELNTLKDKMTKCFEAAATATGCKVELEWLPEPYENMLNNSALTGLYEANTKILGVRNVGNAALRDTGGSTDMGNVSHVAPSIHPMFYIGTTAMNHTREFSFAAGQDEAQPYTLAQAKALAMTAIDVLYNPHLVPKMKAEFAEDFKKDADL